MTLWVREITAAPESDSVVIFLREGGGRWVRFPPEREPGEPVLSEATLDHAMAAGKPLFVEGSRSENPGAVLARFSGRDSWRGIVTLWNGRKKLSARDALRAHELAIEIGRSLTSLRRAETSREEAIALERARLAAELHDGFLQSFLSAKLHAEACLTLEPSNPGRLSAELKRTHDLLATTVSEVRQFLLELRLPPENVEDFVPWLHEYAADFERENGIPVEVRVQGDGGLSKLQAEEATRLVREALTNVRKHAKAHSVRIVVAFGRDGSTICISDDGMGFDLRSTMERVLESSHNGLIGMRYRAESIGGEMRLRTEPGKGTTLLFRLRHQKKKVEVERREEKPPPSSSRDTESVAPAASVPSVRDSLRSTFEDLISAFVEEEGARAPGSDPGEGHS